MNKLVDEKTLEEINSTRPWLTVKFNDRWPEVRETLAAALRVVRAAQKLDEECSNPAPDPIYRKTLRDRLFMLLKPFSEEKH